MNFDYMPHVIRHLQTEENLPLFKEVKSFGIPKDPYIPRPVKKKTLRKLKGKKK